MNKRKIAVMLSIISLSLCACGKEQKGGSVFNQGETVASINESVSTNAVSDNEADFALATVEEFKSMYDTNFDDKQIEAFIKSNGILKSHLEEKDYGKMLTDLYGESPKKTKLFEVLNGTKVNYSALSNVDDVQFLVIETVNADNTEVYDVIDFDNKMLYETTDIAKGEEFAKWEESSPVAGKLDDAYKKNLLQSLELIVNEGWEDRTISENEIYESSWYIYIVTKNDDIAVLYGFTPGDEYKGYDEWYKTYITDALNGTITIPETTVSDNTVSDNKTEN